MAKRRPVTDTLKGNSELSANGIKTLDDSEKEYKKLMVARRRTLEKHRKILEESVRIRATDLAVRINVRG